MSKDCTAPTRRSSVSLSRPISGLSPDAVVLTAEGAIPAAYLDAGERIVTRRGMRVLKTVLRQPWPVSTRAVLVSPVAFGGHPNRTLILPARQRVLVRGQHSGATHGRDMACPEIGTLVNGTSISWAETPQTGLIQLYVGQPEILYVDGLELASADTVPVVA